MSPPARRRANRLPPAVGIELDMSESQPLLATFRVAKSYGPVVALREVDFAVRRGEVHALLGANGAGKSTLVKILAGVHPADTGAVHVDGRAACNSMTPSMPWRSGIATVFQDPALIPDLNVIQNLQLSEIKESAFTNWLEWFDLQDLDLDASSCVICRSRRCA